MVVSDVNPFIGVYFKSHTITHSSLQNIMFLCFESGYLHGNGEAKAAEINQWRPG
jgi:hypothetical protein